MMARSTSESSVGVCVSWPNVTTTARQARAARKERARKVNKETEDQLQTLCLLNVYFKIL